MAEEKTKKRCQNWSKAEKVFALKLIKSQEDIFERFQGANQGKLKKKLCWEKIALELKASGVCSENRGVEEIRLRTPKNSVRSKVDDSRSTGQGRGDFSIEEEIVAGILRYRNPHELNGIPGCVEREQIAKRGSTIFFNSHLQRAEMLPTCSCHHEAMF
ncbi:uncharacterized protein LOC127865244 isoform X2 [Dreissena polymorpha]|uniref:uncharacterized protein LOC127865244 isoform X2 n=1 Tax=Dreissena polymorpha TaxID=45954 RepID=UPI00226561D6|nr:uncharacterized protein LOC127865244 isoform X2 [Dreissena polymorpha]